MIDTILCMIFLALILLHLSWLYLLARPGEKDIPGDTPNISIVIPAHNEEKVIERTIESALTAPYPGRREVIVVNDGSSDRTEEILNRIALEDARVRLINTSHAGKARAINLGAEKASHDIIIAIDADSELKDDALKEIVQPFSREGVGAVSGIIRASLTNNPLTWFQDFEYILSSGWRYLCNKINGTYILPGFLAVRKGALLNVGGFSSDILSEDFEIGVKLKKGGYGLKMTNATIYTTVPETIRGLIKQRVRWGRGAIQVMRKHSDVILNPAYGSVGLYGIPTQIYWYIHGIVYTPIFIYQVTEGYFRYFGNLDSPLSFEVAKYFFGWFSIYGMIDYSYKTFTGNYEINLLFMLLFTMFCLYIIYNAAILLKFARPSIKHVFVIFFFFPYSLFALSIHTFPALYELYKPGGRNVWEKSK